MRIGIVIRSVSERTESLCKESILRCCDENSIHIVKDVYPSIVAFERMFEWGLSQKIDWLLGVDADCILRPDWLRVFSEFLTENDTSKTFRISFMMQDYLTGSPLARGNHFYNYKYLASSYRFLKLNKIISCSHLFKLIFRNPRFVTKPESSLNLHFRRLRQANQLIAPTPLGWHGYEQYHAEIFRQYLVRSLRDPKFLTTQGSRVAGVDLDSEVGGLTNEDLDLYVAKMAWENSGRFNLDPMNFLDAQAFFQSVSNEYGIEEKGRMELSLDDFYKRYSIDGKV